MNTSLQKTQLVVIGAGPGGHTAAFLAADRGLQVTLIDSEPSLGGTCLHHGCIPSKTLLSLVQTMARAREAQECGIHFEAPQIHLEKIAAFKKNVIARLSAGLLQLSKQKKITFLQGKASFINSQTVAVEKPNGETLTLAFNKCIIATGSVPLKPAVVPSGLETIMFSSQALEINHVPPRLLVLGGGYIGVEMASIYAGLGAKITLCEMLPQLLSGADQDLAAIVLKGLKKRMADIRLSTTVKKISPLGQGVEVTLSHDGQETNETFDKILVATGRMPNVAALHLKNTKVQQEENGLIKTKGCGATHDRTIYAIGDVIAGPMLAHKASHDAMFAVDAITGKKNKYPETAIPSVVFTDPELAYCGLTEQQAKEKNIKIEVVKFPWAANGRSISVNRTDGLTKFILDAKKKRLLGVGMVGPEAGELIAQALLCLRTPADLQRFATSVYPHPTLSETFKECLELSLGKSFYAFKK